MTIVKRGGSMGMVAACLALCGCGAVMERATESYQYVEKSFRKAGEKMVMSPEEVANKHFCPPDVKNAVFVEKNEVIPQPVSPGTEINNRIQYTLCGPAPATDVNGSITRRILFHKNVVWEDESGETFRPGSWVADSFMTIPKDSPKGTYTFEVVLKYLDQTLRNRTSFLVD